MARRLWSRAVLLRALLDVHSRPGAWVSPLLSGLAAVAAFLGGVLAGTSGGAARVVWLVVAGVGVLATAGLPFGREWARRAEQEAGELRVTLRNALQPLAESIAALPAMSPDARSAELGTVGAYAVAALTLVMDGVPNLRSVAYQFDETGEVMTCLAYHGRGGPPPQEFRAGTPRGDSAIALVRSAGTVVVADLAAERPEEYAGSGQGYRTFISVSIHDATNAYGMLTVDAPLPHTLAALDVHLLEVVADLLSIAFSITRAPGDIVDLRREEHRWPS